MSKKVLVLGYGSYCTIFLEEGFDVVDEYDKDLDLVVFTGGTDISPDIYSEKRTPYTSNSDDLRDSHEVGLFHQAVSDGIPMVGICRGAQLLCALNGGKLIQHVMGHACDVGHTIYTGDGKQMQATSSHHQMMQPDGEFELLAWASGVGNGHLPNSLSRDDDGLLIEPEVVYWPGTQCLGHQPHPEWMKYNSEYYKYFFDTINKYLGV